MPSAPQTSGLSKEVLWAGRVMGAVSALLLLETRGEPRVDRPGRTLGSSWCILADGREGEMGALVERFTAGPDGKANRARILRSP